MWKKIKQQSPMILVIWMPKVLQLVINPLSTTGLLTPFLIDSYHELITYLANHYKGLKKI